MTDMKKKPILFSRQVSIYFSKNGECMNEERHR